MSSGATVLNLRKTTRLANHPEVSPPQRGSMSAATAGIGRFMCTQDVHREREVALRAYCKAGRVLSVVLDANARL